MPDHEAELLASAAARDLAGRAIPERPMLKAPPPVRIIDCVLSLRRNYKTFVCPRVAEYQQRFPRTVTCDDLVRQITSFPTALEFLSQVLHFRSEDRAKAMLGVAQKLDRLQGQFPGDTEAQRLSAWAARARPEDYASFGVRNFGISGFQYLRILFGANTVKPDIHINRYVAKVVGRAVQDLEAINLIERAALVGGWPADGLDGLIWELQANWRPDRESKPHST